MHTPGPWRDGGCGRIILNGSNCYMVTEIWNAQGGHNPDDIRLMAAAPELLDACAELLAIVGWELQEDPNAEELDGMRRAAALAERAIAKAEGTPEQSGMVG